MGSAIGRKLALQKNEIMKSRIEQLQAFLKDEIKDSFLRYGLALEYVRVSENHTAKDCFLKLIEDDENI